MCIAVELSYGEVWRGDESPLHDLKIKNLLPQAGIHPRRSHGRDGTDFTVD
jgi:hypothetical protein